MYHIPGHTPGGICLLDRENRILFTGDSIIEQTWMQMKESLPIPVFFESLNKITEILFLFRKAEMECRTF